MNRSAICAADILEAWQESDYQQLDRTLAADATPDCELRADSQELERLEQLQGIANQIRCSLASGQVEDANVYLPLLRHLAGSHCVLPN